MKGIPVTVAGRKFRSARRAALAIGVDHKTILRALRMGYIDKPRKPIGRRRGAHKGQPVIVRGVEYKNAVDVAIALGVTNQAVYLALKRGTQNKIGLRKHGRTKSLDARLNTPVVL